MRFSYGVGLGPWPEDFMATGTDWKTRGKRLDEMIEIIRGRQTGDFFEYRNRFYGSTRQSFALPRTLFARST